MVLSGQEIKRQLGTNIVIDPFDESRLNPNSYNLTLHDELMVYEEVVLDMRKANRVRRIGIPPEGLVLHPNQLYLGRTVERTETHNFVPMIEGRSSIGRLGLFVHVTAGFGDVGFCGYWTLEMFAVQPVRIYAGVAICQIFYHDIHGDVHRVPERQVPAQHRHPAEPVVQGTQPRVRQRPATEAALRHGAVARVNRNHGVRAEFVIDLFVVGNHSLSREIPCNESFTRRVGPDCVAAARRQFLAAEEKKAKEKKADKGKPAARVPDPMARHGGDDEGLES